MNAKGILAKADDWLQRFELLVICLCLAGILLAVCANVVSRALNLRWLEVSDLALAAMTMLTFIGSAYAVARHAHINIDLREVMPGSGVLKRWLYWGSDLVIAVTSLLLIVYGGDMLAYVIQIDERTASLELPLWMPVGSLWLGSVLSLIHLALAWVGRWSSAQAADRQRSPLTSASTPAPHG